MLKFKSIRITNSEKYIEINIDQKEDTLIRVDRYISNHFKMHWNTIQRSFRNNDIFLFRPTTNSKIKHPNEKLVFNDKLFISKKLLNHYQNNETNHQSLMNKNEFNKISSKEQKYLKTLFKKMIVMESNELIILNKLCNLACQDGSYLKFSIDTMLKIINTENSNKNQLKLIHRLDKLVSGLMIIGSNIEAVRQIGDDLKESRTEKIYVTLVQDIPFYLKYLMYNYSQISLNNENVFLNSLSGNIKSTDSCDQFFLELNSGIKLSEEMFLLKNKTINSVNNRNLVDFNMFGKYRIAYLIFYNPKSKQYKLFNLANFTNYDAKNKSSLRDYLEKVIECFKQNLNNYEDHVECYSIIFYELGSGKKHQIRKHMSKCLNTPIFNDFDYLFNQDISKEGYKLFSQIEEMDRTKKSLHDNTEDTFQNFTRNYKIGNVLKSILLHSLQIRLPNIQLNNVMIDKTKIELTNLNNKITRIDLLNISENFSYLFRKMNLNITELENSFNYNKLI